jgi:hypothetical protein
MFGLDFTVYESPTMPKRYVKYCSLWLPKRAKLDRRFMVCQAVEDFLRKVAELLQCTFLPSVLDRLVAAVIDVIANKQNFSFSGAGLEPFPA